MANTIFQPEKVKEVTRLWADLTSEVNRAVEVLVNYRKEASNMPSNYINNLEKIKTSQEELTNAQARAIAATEKTKQRELELAKERERTERANNKIKKSQDALTASQKEEERQIKRNNALKAKQQKTTSKLNKENFLLNEQIKEINRNLREEARGLIEVEGEYNKIQQNVNRLTKEYNDLAIQQELNGKLNNKQLITLGKLENEISEQASALQRVDQRIGRHTRNVGNYKSAYDGLGVSIAQVTREFPAFANSMQTGFLAISNNLPIVVDEIDRLKKANIELAKAGKPTQSIFKALGKAIFSWQSLISVGITLLTAYGAKLIESVFSTDKATEATKRYNEQIAEENKNLRENLQLRSKQLQATRNFINSKDTVIELRNVLNDLTFDSERAEIVLGELSSRLSEIGIDGAEHLIDQNILASDRVVIAANLLEIEEQNIKLQQERLRVDAVRTEKQKIQEAFKNGEISKNTRSLRLLSLESSTLNGIIEIQKEINRLREANNTIIAKTIEIEKDDIKKDDIKRERLKALDLESKSTKSLVKDLTDQIKVLERVKELYQENSEEASFLASRIDFLQSMLALKPEAKEGLEELDKFFKTKEKDRKIILELQKATDDFLSSFQSDVFKDSGLSSLNQFFDGTFQKLKAGASSTEEKFAVTFNAIAEVGQEAFGLLSQFGQQNFEAQFSRLAQEKEIALKFAGDSTSAREDIERQYEERRAAIQRKQAQSEKKQAIFNIIINTAQAIAAAVAKSPLTGGLPFSAIAAGIGAAQIHVVNSQPLPEFKDGVRNFKGGWAILGDGGRHEIGVTPDRTVFRTPAENTLYNLPKGTDIYKSEGEFNRELDNILAFNGILNERNMLPYTKTDTSISKIDFYNGINKLINKIDNNESGGIHFDERGFTKYINNGHGKTIIKNNRLRIKGRKV